MLQEIQPLYDKTIECPVCGKSYTSKKLRSRFLRIEMVDSDFFTKYKDAALNPLYYEVSVCPHCGFAIVETFSKKLSVAAKSNFETKVSANWKNERDFSNVRTVKESIEAFKLAIISGTVIEEKNIVLAGVCLRLAWLYRIEENAEQENRFIQFALEKYIKAYELGEFVGTQMTEMRLLYLIGELYRRLNNRDGAIKYFSKVISHKNKSIETKLVEMAREQWYLTKQE